MSASDPTVGEMTEGEVLGRILRRLGSSRAHVGPGDDAAVISVPGGRIVATVDTLVHGPDFRLAWSSAFDLGWKAAAVNLADVAAMGARPVSLLVALAMPDETRASFVEGLADGLRAACEQLSPGCTVDGGDLTVSYTLTIAVTALGVLDDGEPVLRSGARAGDAVAIVGPLGEAAHGLDILFTRFTDSAGHPVAVDPALMAGLPADADARAIVAQLRPRPPIAAGAEARAAGATALMDVSDGLALDATRLADASGVTIDLEAARLGPDVARALSGGEDHALLATFPHGSPLPEPFRRIGVVTQRTDVALTVDGAPFGGRGGWDPYRDWDAGRG
ncbi:thiamine-phosphate kinase [Microbacterium sp. 2FI]|uniref:thiamine-phosphate kinase n=1 Tax=Microbacterium sp. 2FI TaxID=2502193 RepID=UPI0010F6B253|nr:thiamine-phosphate kinase [Microbacterium sp. 2FI]